MALTKFTFHEGTAEKPVVLSQRQLQGLVALSLDNSVEKDISGVVYKPTLYDSEVDALEAMGFVVMTDATLQDQFTVSPDLEYVNEGESVSISANGINVDALIFEIANVKVTFNSDNLEDDYIRRKLSFAGNVLKVKSAEENSSWIAEVTFRVYPGNHPENYRSGKVTVNAVGITGVSILGESMLSEGEQTTYTAQVLPANNTKTHSAISISAEYGNVNGNTYVAPFGYPSDTIKAVMSAFGVTYTSTKSIVVGTVILNDTDKNPLVFSAIKSGLKSAGWSTLGGEAIDGATAMTSIDAYNVSNADFISIIKAMKSIGSEHTFEESAYFMNVTDLTFAVTDNTNNMVVFSPKLTGTFTLPNLTKITATSNGFSYNHQGFLAKTNVQKVDLPNLEEIYSDGRGYFQYSSCAIFADMPLLTEVNMPKLLYLFKSDSPYPGCGDLFVNDNISVFNAPKLMNMKRRIMEGSGLKTCSPFAFINTTSLVLDYLSDASQAFSYSKLYVLSLGAKASKLSIGKQNFTFSAKLRSVYMPNLVSADLYRLFAGCTQLKAYTGSNDDGIDESFDGTEGVLDWSNTKLKNIVNGVDAFNGCNSLYKIKFPASLTEMKGNSYVWNNSKVCVVDIRNCKNLNLVDSFFHDERANYRMKFVRFVMNTPPVANRFGSVIFVPTAKFTNYINATGISRYYVKNKETNNKIYVYSHTTLNTTYTLNAPVISGSSSLVLEFDYFNSQNNYIVSNVNSSDQTVFGIKTNGNTLYLQHNNNQNVTIGQNMVENHLIAVELTFGSGQIGYKVTDKDAGTVLKSGTITSNVANIDIASMTIGNNNSSIGCNFASLSVLRNNSLIAKVVPVIDEMDVPTLYDTVGGKQLSAAEDYKVTIDGTLVEMIDVDTSGRVGTYDEVRAKYEQYLEDRTTECDYDYNTASNKVFPDEMMDWMCKSVLGVEKTWQGDLEDVPVELLK